MRMGDNEIPDAMSKDEVHDLLTRVQVMRATHTYQTHGLGATEDCDEVRAFNALESILSLEKMYVPEFEEGQGKWDWLEPIGYNECLDTTWAKIAEKVKISG